MPQGERTPAEKVNFQHMLSNINLLYLGTSVLVLLGSCNGAIKPLESTPTDEALTYRLLA